MFFSEYGYQNKLKIYVSVQDSNTSQRNRSKSAKEVSVMAWITNQFGHVLLLKQQRGKRLWTLPGGKVRKKESLIRALEREVREETGLKIHNIVFIELFDRPQKGVLTFLFSAKIKGNNDTIYPKEKEIETARFSALLPRNATPSLNYFWSQVREITRGR